MPGLFRRFFVVCSACWLLVVPVRAQQPAPAAPPDLPALFAKAVNSFAANDFQGAVSAINTLLANVPKDLKGPEQAKLEATLEPLYFTLGAAYFNLKDYAKATDALKDYLAKYPRGARVTDATFSLAQASYLNKDYNAAAKAFAALENTREYRDQAIMYEALAYKDGGDLPKAVAALEKLTASGIKSKEAARAGMQLVSLYAENKQPEKAAKMLTDLEANVGQVENIVDLNVAALSQGDAYLKDDKNALALACYRVVRTKDEVIALEKDRLEGLQDRLRALQGSMRADPKNAGQYLNASRQVQDAVAAARKRLDEFVKLPSIRSKLLYRMGRAFSGAQDPWKAIVAYTDAYEMTQDPADREPALFALVTSYADVNQPKDARTACLQYLKEFPKGPNAGTAGYLVGVTALQENDPAAAEGYFGRIIAEQPDNPMRDDILFLLANAQFAQVAYDKAEGSYRKYMAQFPTGRHFEEAYYRLALCSVFSGKYGEGAQRIDDYLGKYPHGDFEQDARYRRALCDYAAQEYPKAIAQCEDWLKKFPNDQQSGEVLSLLGDCYNSTNKPDEALDAYERSVKVATTDEVLNYTLGEATKILQKRGEWDKISDLYQEVAKARPDSPIVVQSAYWVARAKSKEGKTDEAKQIVAGMIRKYIDDPQKGAVEQLIDQLANLCSKRRPARVTTRDAAPAVAAASASPAADGPAASAAPEASPAAAVAAATPEATPTVDPAAELEELLGGAAKDPTPTARARVLYAKAQLARLQRKPDQATSLLLTIGADFKPAALSPVLLGQVGDALVAKGRLDEAVPFYKQLMDNYPKSDVADYAYNGLGEIAYQKKQYGEALHYFADATDKVAVNQKLKDVTVGQAKTLLALGRLDEAKKLFEQVASTREWRGETTAYCVYSLGQIEEKQDHWAEANAYFQRVFVAYQRYLPWVAKAYMGSAESLEKLGKKQDAIKTYQEMLRNDKLADFPEAAAAREKLAALGAS